MEATVHLTTFDNSFPHEGVACAMQATVMKLPTR
jgi:hypothetical protein